jgi:uncharacterized membrane protein YcfT
MGFVNYLWLTLVGVSLTLDDFVQPRRHGLHQGIQALSVVQLTNQSSLAYTSKRISVTLYVCLWSIILSKRLWPTKAPHPFFFHDGTLQYASSTPAQGQA